MTGIWSDLYQSVRSLSHRPVFAATIVLTIGLGLGATTAMVGVIRAVLINPLPYEASDSLFWIYTDNPPFQFRLSVVDYRALEADHPAFSKIAAYQSSRVTVTDGGTAERVPAKSVTGSYFPLLGQTPAFGRLFDESDDARRDQSVVLTHAYWMRHFGGDASAVGRTMSIDGASYTITGVLQRTVGPLEHDVALFTCAHWPAPTRKGPFFTMVLGRLRPEVSRAAALETLHATNARLFPIWRTSYQDEKATWSLMDLKTRVVGDVGSTLLLVLAAVGCVLLIACANAVNLLIARAAGRSRELAIRGALGASRARLLQHIFTETAVLSVASSIVGFAIAALAMGLVTTYGGTYIPRIDEVSLTNGALEWLAALTVASGLLIGVVPALHGARLRADLTLGSGGRSSTDRPAVRRLRRVLVGAEFALATPLLVAAVLILASLSRLNDVPVGVDTGRMISGAVSLPAARYATADARKAFWLRAIDRLAALPGVEVAAIGDSRPPNDSGQTNNFDLEDHPTPPGQNQPLCPWAGVSPGFFKAAGLPLERGRLLDDHSLQDNVVVVDRAWADRFFPGENALGRRFHSGGCSTCPWETVVGIVGTAKFRGLDAPDQGIVYFPLVDVPNAYVFLRTSGDPATLAAELRQAVHELDPGLALSNVATGRELVADSLTKPRYLSLLIGAFAITALLLSIVGIYGVMSYFVQQHTRDIGIRLALGGDPSSIRRMVVGQGLGVVAAGSVIGVAAAVVNARVIRSALFGIGATDARILLGVPAVLLAVAFVACLIPARRAAAVDPAEILRES